MIASEGIRAMPKNDNHKEYALYAEHCLKIARIASDHKSRIIQREMAAEWLKLADAPSQSAK
jgi:hypothetical protein